MRLLRQGGGVLAARLGQAAANALAGWLVARVLGPALQGQYSLLLMMVAVGAALLNGGLGLAAVPPLRDAEVSARRMLRAQGLWILAMTLLGALLGWGLTVSGLAGRIGLADLPTAPLVAALAAMAGLLAFEIMLYDLLALGRLHSGPVVNMFRAVLHLAALVVLIAAARLTLSAALAAYAITQLGAAAVATGLVRRIAVREDRVPGSSPPLPGLIRDTFSRGWLGQLSAIASILHLRLDLMIVAWFHGTAAVGVYTVAVLAAELLWHLPNALQPLLVYSSSGRGDADRDRTTLRAIRVGLLATAVGAVAWLIVARPVFSWLLSPEYAASVPALWALLPGIVVFSAGSVLAGDFIGRGRPVWNTQASVLTVAVNILAGLIWIPGHGVVGAAWASSVAYLAGALLMIWRFRRVSGFGAKALITGNS